MGDYILAESNGRKIPERDVIFGISSMANERAAKEGRDRVINGTIGSLLDDDGNLMILSSVVRVLKNLEAKDFADYAPIGGLPSFHQAVLRETFRDFTPKSYSQVIATPGGTGAIRNTIVNYSKRGDKILTADWYWGPYNTIAQEHERAIASFISFDDRGAFNHKDFEEKVWALVKEQGKLVILLNSPANNPTGKSLTDQEWDGLIEILERAAGEGYKITLFVDIAYIDYAGDPLQVRQFLKKLDGLNPNLLVVLGFSMSKGYTLYGMRGGAMIGLSSSQEVIQEFKKVCEHSCRGTWSNCTRAVQVLMSKVHENETLLKEIREERAGFREILLERGRAFEEGAKECGLKTIPYDGGFFASVPCEKSDLVVDKLMEEGIFLVPIAKGIRVAVSSVSKAKLKTLAFRIKEVIDIIENVD